jgi:aryl-alcohol dehydrogenase-like predicted oxidoreductase
MTKPQPAELVLGAVQLGLEYGAANRTGKPSRHDALKLVQRAADCGITKFDTARAYGDSEHRLGEALRARKSARTITKLSPLSELAPNASRDAVRDAVDASISESLYALRRDQIDCLLLHRAAHMTAFDGAVWERLIERLEDGTVLAIGVSVQSPDEALAVLASKDVRHIQLPFNLLDWRWRNSGVITRLAKRPAVTVHVRSVFLQGLLASEDASIWPAVDGVDPHAVISCLRALTTEFRRESLADLCLAYARGQDWIDGVVVGMETEAQLECNLRLGIRSPLSQQDCETIEHRIPRVPVRLLDPSQWPKKT